MGIGLRMLDVCLDYWIDEKKRYSLCSVSVLSRRVGKPGCYVLARKIRKLFDCSICELAIMQFTSISHQQLYMINCGFIFGFIFACQQQYVQVIKRYMIWGLFLVYI